MESALAKPFVYKAESLLSAERFERFKRLKKKDDKLDCLAIGLIINKVFGDNSVLYKDKNGCPCLKHGGYISISHSGGVCAVAVSDSSVGLDIQEHSERNYMSIGRIVFCENELSYLSQTFDLENDFYKLWCLKESYMKAKGLGFELSPKSFSFGISGKDIILNSNDEKQWSFACFNIGELTAALCCETCCEYSLINISLT
ncbi:4'-phosphopantetheinyl transferase superfamily protein [Ruminococcus sp. zg-924]|nr:4'-phosphopantetheinyl transferase superfamily protein [Ruminococcus sp. zg-924]MCQ4114384.1 4'-phosphopantetheinyl transferase superfamily protein [Ruminococcus sp. zg-921]